MRWNDSYRKLFFDYHNHAENHSIAKDFDAEKFAEKLEEVGCELVSVFAMGGRGHKYFRKGEHGVVHPLLPDDVDMVEDVVRECHKRNIKVLGYCAYGINQDYLLKAHPEFIHCSAPGVFNETGFTNIHTCCIGACNDYLLKIYEELCTNYDIDQFFLDGSYNNTPCFCETCRNSFREKTGHEIPTSKESENWKEYINWYQQEMERFRAQVRETVHKAKPGIEVIINWVCSYRSPDPIPEDADILFSDVPFPNELEGIDICARSYALTGKKFEIHNTAFLKQWGEWGLAHTNVLKRAAALLLANGTNVHMGYQFYPKFHVDEGVWNAFKDVFDWVKPLEKHLQNNEIKPYIGAYMSNVQSGLTHTGNIWSEPLWLYGFNKMMINSGLHYNLLGSQHLKESIDKFSAIFLPDMRYISDEEVEIFENYVRNGGTLIATGLTGTMDKMGNYQGDTKLANLLGIKWCGRYDEPYSYLKITDETLAKNTSDMPLSMEAETALVEVNTAKKLATIYDLYKTTDGKYAHRYSPAENDTGYAGVTVNEYGKGKAFFFANEISQAYYKTFQWNIVEMIKNVLFDIAKIEKKVFATGDGAIELTLAKKDNATQIHMVNMLGTQPNVQGIGYPSCMPQEIYDLNNIKVTAIHDYPPTKVINVTRGEEIPFTSTGDTVQFTVPVVGLYEIIEIL